MMVSTKVPTPRGPTSRPPASTASVITWSAGASDAGQHRDCNEDQFLITSLRAGADEQLLVVADGMGGRAGGEEASALAVKVITESLQRSLDWMFALEGEGEDLRFHLIAELKAAMVRADAAVCEAASEHPELQGMGTTLTMAYTHGNELLVAHVGDSRCYLLRGGALRQLTEDHTLVGEMVRSGLLTPDRAAEHRLRHIITNVVGGPKLGVRPEVHSRRLLPGDVVLLCTDGLTEMVSDSEITAVLSAYRDPREAAERLVALANECGGVDNVTVVVSRVEHCGIPESERRPR